MMTTNNLMTSPYGLDELDTDTALGFTHTPSSFVEGELAVWQKIFIITGEIARFQPRMYLSHGSDQTQLIHASLELKKQLREHLEVLKIQLEKHYSEVEVYQVLFAIVVFADEVVQTKLADYQQVIWPTLQKELFSTEEGGSLFFSAIDKTLEKQAQAGLAYQVYFYCLKNGFKGQYFQEPQILESYKLKLKNKIHSDELTVQGSTTPLVPPTVIVKNRGMYYVYALGAIVATYLVLILI